MDHQTWVQQNTRDVESMFLLAFVEKTGTTSSDLKESILLRPCRYPLLAHGSECPGVTKAKRNGKI